MVFYLAQVFGDLSIAATPARTIVRSADSPAKAAADRLAWDFDSWKAVEIRVQEGFANHDKNPIQKQSFDRQEIHYVELKNVERFYDVRYFMGASLNQRLTHVCDGTRSAVVNYMDKDENRQKSAIPNKWAFWKEDKSDHVDRPIPILFNYVGRVPLHEALAKAKYLGEEREGGRECAMFLFSGVKWGAVQDRVFYLDAASHIPVRVSSYPDQASREKGEPDWVWTADKLETFQGHVIPVKSTQIKYNPDDRIPLYT